jgi:hypothetical protein
MILSSKIKTNKVLLLNYELKMLMNNLMHLNDECVLNRLKISSIIFN